MKSFSPRRSPRALARLACALAAFAPIAAKETNRFQVGFVPEHAAMFRPTNAKAIGARQPRVPRAEQERPLVFHHDAGLALIIDVVCLLDEALSNRTRPAAKTPSHAAWEADEPSSSFEEKSAELLARLRAITAELPMTRHEFLSTGGNVQRAVFGRGAGAVVAVINTGETDFRHHSSLGGDVVLPLFGFVVEAPGFALVHASRWSGVDYDHPPLFTLRSLDGRPLANSRRVDVFRDMLVDD